MLVKLFALLQHEFHLIMWSVYYVVCLLCGLFIMWSVYYVVCLFQSFLVLTVFMYLAPSEHHHRTESISLTPSLLQYSIIKNIFFNLIVDVNALLLLKVPL